MKKSAAWTRTSDLSVKRQSRSQLRQPNNYFCRGRRNNIYCVDQLDPVFNQLQRHPIMPILKLVLLLDYDVLQNF